MISVVIITRDRAKKLKRCINSLKGKVDEIIIIDNGSTDHTQSVIKRFKIHNSKLAIKYSLNEKNAGVAKARNQGALLVRNKYILFLDDDAYLKISTSIDQITRYMENNDNVSVCLPKIVYPSRKIQESIRSFPNLLGVIWRGLGLYKIFPNARFYKSYTNPKRSKSKPQEIDWGIGACMLVRKLDFDELSGFDENFFFGWEDIDFCKRVRAFKKKAVYIPNQTVIHDYERSSARGIVSVAKVQHIKSILYYHIKHTLNFART